MIGCQALQFGSFTLKSGRASPFFMNAGAYVTGSQLAKLGSYYAQAVHENFGDAFDVFFGPAYKGIPLAAAAAIAYSALYGKDVRFCANRKEAKDHGDAGILLGSRLHDGDRVVIIEDVITSGKSIDETYPIIKGQGGAPDAVKIVGEVVSLDRMERTEHGEGSALDAVEARYGFPVRAIVTMADVIDALYTNGARTVITDAIKTRIDAYYAEYGAWSARVSEHDS